MKKIIILFLFILLSGSFLSSCSLFEDKNKDNELVEVVDNMVKNLEKEDKQKEEKIKNIKYSSNINYEDKDVVKEINKIYYQLSDIKHDNVYKYVYFHKIITDCFNADACIVNQEDIKNYLDEFHRFMYNSNEIVNIKDLFKIDEKYSKNFNKLKKENKVKYVLLKDEPDLFLKKQSELYDIVNNANLNFYILKPTDKKVEFEKVSGNLFKQAIKDTIVLIKNNPNAYNISSDTYGLIYGLAKELDDILIMSPRGKDIVNVEYLEYLTGYDVLLKTYFNAELSLKGYNTLNTFNKHLGKIISINKLNEKEAFENNEKIATISKNIKQRQKDMKSVEYIKKVLFNFLDNTYKGYQTEDQKENEKLLESIKFLKYYINEAKTVDDINSLLQNKVFNEKAPYFNLADKIKILDKGGFYRFFIK